MATRTETILLCDSCGSADATTHTMTIDGKAVEFEACEKCWEKIQRPLAKPLSAARKRPSRKRKVA